MSGVADMNVRIGADISEVLSKVDAAKAKLNQLVETQGQLKDKINDVNTSLRLNEKELTAANVKLQNLNTSSKEGKAAAANLRNEISQLAKNSALLNTELTTAKTTLATTTAEIKTQTVAVKQAENAHSGLAAGATKVYSGLRKLAYIIPGMGIAGIINLISGPLIDAFSDWYDSINRVTDAQKSLQANLQNYNDINSEANKDAGKQIATLKILYDASTNVTLSMKERLAAVKALQKDFPDYFKNISQETILNGGAKTAYDNLTESIIKASRAKAGMARLQELESKQLDNDNLREKIRNAADQQIAQIYKNGPRQLSGGSSSSFGTGTGSAVTISIAEQIAAVNKSKNAALEQLGVNDELLKSQQDFIVKWIGLSDLAKAAETEIKPPKIAKEKTTKDVETIADVLQKLAIQIDFLNQKEIVLKTSQANAKVSAIESTVNTLMQKFKLLADNPVIVSLEMQIKAIQGDAFLKTLLKSELKAPLAAPPLDLQILLQKPDVKFAPGAFDEQILREELLKRLKEMGTTKTVSVDLGVDVTGNKISSKGGETITSGTSTTQLQATFKDATEKLKSFSDNASNIVNNMAADMAVSIGEAIGNAFTGQGDAVKGLFDGIFSVLGSALQQLGKVAIETGLGIKAIRESFKSLNPIVAIAAGVGLVALGTIIKNSVQSAGAFANGGLVKAFSNGGPVWGAGTATSDSIPARLSKGEYVIRAAKVREFGLDFFNKINFGSANMRDILRDKFGMMKFATGGFVSPNGINLSQPISIPNINIGGGQQIFIAESKLRGQDIVTSFKRASATISRNS